MTPLWEAPAIVLAVLAWLTMPPASLADAAQREALRRQMMPKSVTSVTNLGQPEEVVPPAVSRTDLPAEPPAAAPKPEPPAEPSGPARDEKWWRARVASIRTAIDRDTLLADSVQSRINSLQTEAVNTDDPARQSMVRDQLAKSINELERLKKQVEDSRKAFADLQVEARRQGVPPGWLRDRLPL